MQINYLRSSSYGRFDWCPHCYFAEYALGWTGPANKKADMGTICHKVFEILAIAKKGLQDGLKEVDTECIGIIPVVGNDINKLTEEVFAYYSKILTSCEWSSQELTICKDWVWKAIKYNGGEFDPRKRKIISPEARFDFEITKPWAIYNTPDGDSTFLALKGTIDLITEVDDSVYEIIDWKTGKRINWSTGEEKTLDYLRHDPQLCMYHYAAHHLFPKIKQFIVTIFFINDGGAFSICFEKSDLQKTEKMLQSRFEEIIAYDKPILNRSWRCSKLCHLGKTTFLNTEITPMKEFRDGQQSAPGHYMTKCAQLEYAVNKYGIDKTTEVYTKKGFKLDKYHEPGSGE